MKYGDSLRQRSVPQWAFQNVAYDSIKHLIKQQTTPGKGKAVAIPGQRDKVDTDFENELFDILADQHSNVSLFVRSKSGEIDRRLDHLSKTLRNLQLASWPASGVANRIQPSRFTKYARIEEQALQIGEEIKSLSRYIGAQRTAFIKLLKKYKKWTGRTNLQERWDSKIAHDPDSFTKIDLGSSLDHWVELLQTIRFAMGVGLGSSASTPARHSLNISPMAPKQSSTILSSRIHDALSSGSDVDFESILAATPLGAEGAWATYWVHPDQLVELQVLLLQQTRLAFPKSPSKIVTGTSTPPVTRRSSTSKASRDSATDKEQSAGMIILDDPNEFPLLQNSFSIGDAEDSSEPAVSMRWVGSSNIAISLKSIDSADTSEFPKHSAKLQPKHLASFLDIDKGFTPRSSNTDLETLGTETPNSATTDNHESLLDTRKWLSENRQVQPLVGLTYKRSRFASFPSGRDSGQWCTLDTDILMRAVSPDDLKRKNWQQTFSDSSDLFPYALIKVRREGNVDVDLIKLLDESHLTERVRGFSLVAHALWTCRRPSSMTPPFWLPLLSSDIRKLPTANGARRSRPSSARRNSLMGAEDLTTSSTAVSIAESSTSGTRTGRHLSRKLSVKGTARTRDKRKKSQTFNIPQQRYWSEYDIPEDSNSGAGYYIYVNPEDDDSWIPFKDTAMAVYSWFKNITSPNKRLETEVTENRSLLQSNGLVKNASYASSSEEMNSATSSETEADSNDMFRPHTISYGTLPVSQPLAVTSMDRDTFGVTLASMIALFFSTTLSVILLVLSAVGRRRARGEVDFVILAGLFISLIFAIGGFWGALKNGGSAIRMVISTMVFGLVVIMDGLLAGKLFREL